LPITRKRQDFTLPLWQIKRLGEMQKKSGTPKSRIVEKALDKVLKKDEKNS